MSTPAFGAFLAQAGALLTAMLLARRYVLRHVPMCCLPPWVRARELRREVFCRRATAPAIAATITGLVLLLLR